MKRHIILLFTSLMIILSIGCGGGDDNTTDFQVKKNILKINGKNYTTKDLWDFANMVLWEMEPNDLGNEKVKSSILRDFIDHKLMLEEADKRGITAHHSNKKNQLYLQLTTNQGAKELKALTGQYEVDADKLAALSEERIIIDELIQLVATNLNYISEAELKAFYTEKINKKKPLGKAHIAHLFTTDISVAQVAAGELESGIIFSEVARKYSEGPEKSNGGDLGFVNEIDYPEFFSVAFKLKNGEISPVIKSDYGFHIFKMEEQASEKRNSYESMRQTLLAELYIIKRQEMIGEFINVLRSKADIQYINNFTLHELIPRGSQR